jgi:DNA-binding NarL/FixJ family response regulator
MLLLNLLERSPEVRRARLLLVVDEQDLAMNPAFLALRAAGHLDRQAQTQTLFEALRSVHRHGAYISESLAGPIEAAQPRVAEDLGRLRTLTHRERDVLQRLAAGASPDEIARSLDLHRHTVAGHRRQIFTKLRVRSEVAAARFYDAYAPYERLT